MPFLASTPINDMSAYNRIWASFESDFTLARAPAELALFKRTEFDADSDVFLLFAPSLTSVPLTAATAEWSPISDVDHGEQWSLLIGHQSAFDDFAVMRPRQGYGS
jgi:hypothetical protein